MAKPPPVGQVSSNRSHFPILGWELCPSMKGELKDFTESTKILFSFLFIEGHSAIICRSEMHGTSRSTTTEWRANNQTAQ